MRVVVLLCLVLGAACSSPPAKTADHSPTARASRAAGPTAGTPPRTRSATVPPVARLSIAEARSALSAKGFRAKLRTVELSACVRPRVLRQNPPRGSRRNVGSTVRLDVTRRAPGPCGLDLPPPEPALQEAAAAFVDFARGGVPDEALLDNDVALYLGGTLLHSIPPQRAVHRLSYGWLCPNYGYYSARICPFSAIRAIATYPGPMAATRAAPGTACGGGRFLHGRFERTVTLTPDEGRSCVDYFAVELALDPAGQLEAVNLVWAEP